MKISHFARSPIIVFISLILSCAVRKSEPVKGKIFNTNDEHVMNGEKLYMANCQKCHPAGEAGLGPSINSSPAPSFLKRFQMRHGLGVMPSFSPDELTKNDVRDISKYIRAWKSY